jgi:hypothetical protein
MAYRAGFPVVLLSVTSRSDHPSGIVETVGHGLIELQGAEDGNQSACGRWAMSATPKGKYVC